MYAKTVMQVLYMSLKAKSVYIAPIVVEVLITYERVKQMNKRIAAAALVKNKQYGYWILKFVVDGKVKKRLIHIEDLGNGYSHIYSVLQGDRETRDFELLRGTIRNKMNAEELALDIAEVVAKDSSC